MKARIKRHSMDLLFVILIFAIFLFCSVLLISLGTNEYRSILSDMGQNDSTRVAEAYLTQKIRRARAESAVEAVTLEGVPALRLRERKDQGAPADFDTWIYVWDGSLREMTTEPGRTGFVPEVGQEILPAEGISFSPAGEKALLISVTLPEGGITRPFLITITP